MLISLFYASPKKQWYIDSMLLSLFYASPNNNYYADFMLLIFLCSSKEVLLHCFYDSRFISCSVAVMFLSLVYDSISKHTHLTIILPHGRIFSTEPLYDPILTSLIIFYTKFMISTEE